MKKGFLWDCEGQEATFERINSYRIKNPIVFHLFANEFELQRLSAAGCTNIAVLYPLYEPYIAVMSERAVRDYAIQMCRITNGVCVDFEKWISNQKPVVLKWIFEECKNAGKICMVAPKISAVWEKTINQTTNKLEYRALMTGVPANDKARAQFISTYSDYIVPWIYGYKPVQYIADLLKLIQLISNEKDIKKEMKNLLRGKQFDQDTIARKIDSLSEPSKKSIWTIINKLVPMGDTGFRYGTDSFISPKTAAENVKTFASFGMSWCMFMPYKSPNGEAMNMMRQCYGIV